MLVLRLCVAVALLGELPAAFAQLQRPTPRVVTIPPDWLLVYNQRLVHEVWDHVIDVLISGGASGNPADAMLFATVKRQFGKLQPKQTISRVGIFDAGVGNAVVYRVLREQSAIPAVVFSDQERNMDPSSEAIWSADKMAEVYSWLQCAKHVDIILVACNTASISSLPIVDSPNFAHLPILPIIPPYDLFFARMGKIHPQKKRVGIFAADFTCRSGQYQRMIRAAGFVIQENSVSMKNQAPTKDCIGCTECAKAVQGHRPFHDGPGTEKVVEMLRIKFAAYLDSTKKPLIDYIVFGCTQYPPLAGAVRRVLGDTVRFVGPEGYQVKLLKRLLGSRAYKQGARSEDEFVVGNPGNLTRLRIYQNALGRTLAVKDPSLKPIAYANWSRHARCGGNVTSANRRLMI